MLKTTGFQPLQRLRHNALPPRASKAAGSESAEQAQSFDQITFSQAARAPKSPSTGVLKGVGIGVALTVAVGGAFIAGTQFSQPEEVTLESELDNLGQQFKRGFEDFQVDLRRAGEDLETDWQRSYEDAQSNPSEELQLKREWKDLQREVRRESEDLSREVSRTAQDIWNKITK